MPAWLLSWGILAGLANLPLAVRLIWEQTLLTWDRGPQMIGFSMAHAFPFLLLTPLLLLPWVLAAVVLSLYRLIRKQSLGRRWIGILSAGILLSGIPFVPYSVWQSIFASQLAQGPHVSSFLIYAVSDGDSLLVQRLLDRAPKKQQQSLKNLALQQAAYAGQTAILQGLVSRGADLNSLNPSGSSPLAIAEQQGHEEAAAFLRSQGARSVPGASP